MAQRADRTFVDFSKAGLCHAVAEKGINVETMYSSHRRSERRLFARTYDPSSYVDENTRSPAARKV